jgi:cyclohexyl-isocyanide hydratase
MPLEIGFILFPGVQLLDLTGPYDLLAALPGATCHLIAGSLSPMASSTGFALLPSATYATAPPLDVLVVPGGKGVDAALTDAALLTYLRTSAPRYMTSVCTGALLLGVAGLLRNKKATTHWAFHSLLPALGAVPVHARVVRDGSTFTGGGVTAGIDFALTIAAELCGEHQAMVAQLQLEYAPAPPFAAGDPATAPEEVVRFVTEKSAPGLEVRRERIAAGLELVKTLQ